MLRKKEEQGNIRGISVCRGGPQISHLFFANDSIVFCRATVDEGRRILQVLEDYEVELGKKLNKDKTSLILQQERKERGSRTNKVDFWGSNHSTS